LQVFGRKCFSNLMVEPWRWKQEFISKRFTHLPNYTASRFLGKATFLVTTVRTSYQWT
jgi:hypothetical protein